MKGLLVKDIRLLSNQKQFFVMVLFISIVLALSGQDIFFVISYCTMLCAFFTVNSINYDEYNNGYAFLFTMPAGRKEYAIEKYLFGYLTGGSVWLGTTALSALYVWGKEPDTDMGEWFGAAFAILLILGIILAVLIPMQLKFGSEKSRTVMFVFAFLFFAAVMLVTKAAKTFNLPQWNLQWAYDLGMAGRLVVALLAFALVQLLSVTISIRIMMKKQF